MSMRLGVAMLVGIAVSSQLTPLSALAADPAKLAQERGKRAKVGAKPARASGVQKIRDRSEPSKNAEDTSAPSTPAAAIATTPSTTVGAENEALVDVLQKARSLYDAQEYEAVIPLAEIILARADATIDVRLDAYLLQGSSLAIVGDLIEAEKPFRFLLRGRPDFDMSGDTPPKILAVFRKVQVEERAIRDQMRELERARIVRELQFTGEPPTEGKGGQPLPFAYQLRDPGRAVHRFNVFYRRSERDSFSSLALKADDSGIWRAQLPGEWTANDSGVTLQYYVSTEDAQGRALLGRGTATAPMAIHIEPGMMEEHVRPLYKSPWVWVAAGVVVAGGAFAAYKLYDSGNELPQSNGFVELK